MLQLCFYEEWSLFFFKQKTAYEMRISDWSSDVCSSDLPDHGDEGVIAHRIGGRGLKAVDEQRRERADERPAPAQPAACDEGGAPQAGEQEQEQPAVERKPRRPDPHPHTPRKALPDQHERHPQPARLKPHSHEPPPAINPP